MLNSVRAHSSLPRLPAAPPFECSRDRAGGNVPAGRVSYDRRGQSTFARSNALNHRQDATKAERPGADLTLFSSWRPRRLGGEIRATQASPLRNGRCACGGPGDAGVAPTVPAPGRGGRPLRVAELTEGDGVEA